MEAEANPIRLRGDDADEALREWIKTDIKDSPKQTYELGRFFFSVSVGTVGVLAAIEKLSLNPSLDIVFSISMILLLGAILMALYLATPKIREVRGDTDLREMYISRAKSVRTIVWLWFGLWLAGTVVGGAAVRK